MQLQTAAVVTIFAAAVGAAAGRATAPHAPPAPELPGTASHSAASGWLAAGGAEKAGFRESTASVAARAAQEPHFAVPVGAGSSPQSAVVYVAGAVAKPGVYSLRATARANEALHAAGGATAQADLVAINLAARVRDGEEIAVPLRGAEARGPRGAGDSVARPARRHATKRGHRRKRTEPTGDATGDATGGAGAPTEMVDLNTADEATLETLPGVGPSLAQRIVAFRDLNGPFASADELLDVGGMTPGKIDGLSPYVTFH